MESPIFKVLAIVVHIIELSTFLYAVIYALFHKSKTVIGLLISRFMIGVFKASIIFIISSYIFIIFQFIYGIALFPYKDNNFIFIQSEKLNIDIAFLIAIILYLTVTLSLTWIIGTIIWTGSFNHVKLLLNSFLPVKNRFFIPYINKLLIINAKYGANGVFIDVKRKVEQMVVNNSLTITASNDLAGDPIHNVSKTLIIEYQYENKEVKTVEILEQTSKTIKDE